MAYNGWTNYETWNVALWLDNDEGTYRYVREQAESVLADARESETGDAAVSSARGELADWLEQLVKDDAPDLGASMYADLLGAALSEVDWYEIAEHLVSEAAEA